MAALNAAKKKALDVTSAFRHCISMPTITRAHFLPVQQQQAAQQSPSSAQQQAPMAPVWVCSSVKDVVLDETRTWQQVHTWTGSGPEEGQQAGRYVPLGYPLPHESLGTLPSPSRKLLASFRAAPSKSGAAPAGKDAQPSYVVDITDADPSSATHGRVLQSLATGSAHGKIMLTGTFGGLSWGSDERTLAYMAEPRPEDRKSASYFLSAEEEEKQRASAGPKSTPTKGCEFEQREEWGEANVGVVRPRPFVLRWTDEVASIRLHAVKGIPDDVSAGQVIFSGWKESQYRKPEAQAQQSASSVSVPAPLSDSNPASTSVPFDEGLYLTVYSNNQGGGRKLGIAAYNTRESKVCYLSAKWIIDPLRDDEEKRARERAEKVAKDEEAAARRTKGLPEPTADEEAAARDAEYARKHAEAEREKALNRLIVLTPNDHSAQNPRLDGYDPPQLLYTTTEPVWHHIACSALRTFITLPSTLGLFMRTVDAPYDSTADAAQEQGQGQGQERASGAPRVFASNSHEMIPVVEQPSSAASFPGLWPINNALPQQGRFVFDKSHVLLATTWRSQNAVLLCSDEDDSLSRLPAPVDAPAGASLTLYDCDRSTGRVLIGASSLAQNETLYVGEVRILAEGQNVAIGANFLPVCIVHKDGSAYEGEEAQEEDLDVAYAQVRYTRVLGPAQPLHPEAARRLNESRMEIVQVPVPSGQTYPDGRAQLPFEAVLLTPGFDPKKDPLPPLLAFPHGGPHGVSTTAFFNHLAFYAVCGFSVLLINYRGSTGFGQAALASLPGKCGTQDVSDCIAAVELVASRKGAERVCARDNIHVQGGSHGGFLTTHLIGQAPDLFQTAVARNPVCNIANMIGTSDIPDWCFFEALGRDYDPTAMPSAEEYAEMFRASPIAHIKQVHAPLLMLLGGADRRVPQAQANDYTKLLTARGVRTRTLYYPSGQHPLAESVSMEGDVWVNMVQWALKRFDGQDFAVLGEQKE